MRVHHLNCATMCPPVERLIAGRGGLGAGRMVCHCLLVESNAGLILVDTALGTADLASPRDRLGGGFLAFVRPRLDLEETALRQIERLGHRASDVRHIVLTHLDVDHAGGLGDFPEAEVHVMADELEAATLRQTYVERERYRPVQWAHEPRWVRHAPTGERWNGFDAVRALDDKGPLGAEVLLVPLVGHTRGHAGVAVRDGAGWLLHAGDAYFFHGEIEGERRTCPGGLAAFQRIVAVDNRARMGNQARLRQLARDAAGEVRMFSAHDPVELERFYS